MTGFSFQIRASRDVYVTIENALGVLGVEEERVSRDTIFAVRLVQLVIKGVLDATSLLRKFDFQLRVPRCIDLVPPDHTDAKMIVDCRANLNAESRQAFHVVSCSPRWRPIGQLA